MSEPPPNRRKYPPIATSEATSAAAMVPRKIRASVVFNDGGVKHAGQRKKDRDQHPGEGLRLGAHRHDGNCVADVYEDEQENERHYWRAQRQAATSMVAIAMSS